MSCNGFFVYLNIIKFKTMITKIKVTKQEIRTYTSDNDIRTYSYDINFLNNLLSPEDKYVISDKNSNVTWYVLSESEEQKEELTEEQKDVHFGRDAIEILESDGYEITDSAKGDIIEFSYTVEHLKEIAKDGKITGRNIKKLK